MRKASSVGNEIALFLVPFREELRTQCRAAPSEVPCGAVWRRAAPCWREQAHINQYKHPCGLRCAAPCAAPCDAVRRRVAPCGAVRRRVTISPCAPPCAPT
eukprot:gene10759-biopygen2931